MRYGNAILAWLPLAAAISGLCLLAYTVAQQAYRESLNDPQIQMAEDAARHLASSYTPASVVPRGDLIPISDSLAPWIAVYDEKFQPLESSGSLHGAPPMPPAGIFEAALHDTGKDTDTPGENRVTWQPDPATRQALVIVHIKTAAGEGNGYVVSGRNMREIEMRIGKLGEMVFAGCIVLIAFTLALQLALQRYKR